MPFWKLADETIPDILLKQVSPNAFQLLEGFRYQAPTDEAKVYTVPAHDTSRPPDDPNNSTDLASVPAYLWWFVASHGKHTLPALLHDQLVDDRDQAPKREEADLVFRYALRESDVSWLRRRLMYIAVALGTTWEKSKLLIAVFGLHLLALPATIVACCFGWVPWWVPVAVALAGFVWGLSRWPLSVVALVLLGPPTILVWTALGVVWFIELIEELATWRPGKPFERPKFVPYRAEPAPIGPWPDAREPH
ncbi:MAG: DUF1353 domain-containing protein [Thermoleophilia bacterium]